MLADQKLATIFLYQRWNESTVPIWADVRGESQRYIALHQCWNAVEKGAAHGLRIFRNEPARSWRGVLRMDMAGTGLVDFHDAVPYGRVH